MTAILWWMFQVLLIPRFFLEACVGHQKQFARLGLGILVANMLAISVGFYSWQLANVFSVVGVAVLACMIVVKISFLWGEYRRNGPVNPREPQG